MNTETLSKLSWGTRGSIMSEANVIHLLDCIAPPGKGEWRQTGSTVICNPAPTDTDIDYVCWVKGTLGLSSAVEMLSASGYKADMSEHYQDLMAYGFISWKHDKTNIILTKNEDFYKKHCTATQVCKSLNLLNKQERVMVFQAVLYNKFQEPK